MTFKQHPLSAAFPAMQADEYQSLVDSIGSIGVQNPITLYEGMVIDGWHRYSAATEAGMDCPTVELGDIDPRDFVLAQNKARRNLTASQRAAAVTSVYSWVASTVGRRGEPSSPLEKTNAELAAIAGTSTRTIQQTKVAQKAGLSDAVKDGALTAKEAAKVATGKPAKPKNQPPVQDDEGVPEIEQKESDNAVGILAQENEELRTRLAVGVMVGTEEEKAEAADTIADLRQQLKTLTAENAALRASRDHYQSEASQLRKQIKMNEKELKKARAVA